MADTGEIVPRMYGSFRGVDFRGEEVNYSRSPDSLNMWRDYKKLTSVSTRPDFKELYSLNEKIHSITFYKGKIMVHSGKDLDAVDCDTWNRKKIAEITNEGGVGFVFNDKFYIVGGGNYVEWDGTTFKDFSIDNPLTAYVPTTTIAKRSTDATIEGGKSFAEEADTEYAKGRKASGGTRYEDINMLSPYRYNTFCGDGVTTKFELDARDIDGIESISVNDINLLDGEYSVDVTTGTVTTTKAHPAPLTVGQDNIKVLFKKTVNGYFNAIANCTIIRIFDNRIFFSGNPDYPNYFWHCALNDATYISDLDYYKEGQDNGKIRDMVAGNNALWVFREPTDSGADVFYHTPYTDETYGKIYPSSHSSISLGCVGRAVNFNDDIVYFSRRGMEGISGDITTEQMAAHRSSLVDRKLIAEGKYSDMLLAEWRGYLLCFVPKGDATAVYLADSRAMWQNENHYEYEWYYWELPFLVTSAVAYEDKIYCATDKSILVLSDDNGMAECECYWVTPKDKFDTPYKQKTTNKKGCVVEALGDFAILVKTDTDTEFDEIGRYSSTDHIVSRIKKKKFKDIQIKFYSKREGFSLESVTLEAIVGGYIKN